MQELLSETPDGPVITVTFSKANKNEATVEFAFLGFGFATFVKARNRKKLRVKVADVADEMLDRFYANYTPDITSGVDNVESS